MVPKHVRFAVRRITPTLSMMKDYVDYWAVLVTNTTDNTSAVVAAHDAPRARPGRGVPRLHRLLNRPQSGAQGEAQRRRTTLMLDHSTNTKLPCALRKTPR